MPIASVVNIRRVRAGDYDVYCGRPSPWRNPYIIGRDGDRTTVLHKFREYLDRHPKLVERAYHALRGKRLGCFCHPKPCHLDLLVDAMQQYEREHYPRRAKT